MASDFETRKAVLQFDAVVTAVREKGLGSRTNHFLAGVAFALQSPHRGPRVLNALRISPRNEATSQIRLAVLDSIAAAGNPPAVVEDWDDESVDEGGEDESCCEEQDTDNFCSQCGAEL